MSSIASEIYRRKDFPVFIRDLLSSLNQVIEMIILDKDDFLLTISKQAVMLIGDCMSIIDVILNENVAPAYAFFEEIVVDGVKTIHFIPEFLQTLSLFQVWLLNTCYLVQYVHVLEERAERDSSSFAACFFLK